MLVSENFEGSRAPFEGDRLLMLRSVPEGAQVTNATVTLKPVAPPGGVLFEERISFRDGQGDWGARKRETSPFSEVDFHARRTLLSVAGSGLTMQINQTSVGANLQVDIGGLYVQINKLGAMITPDDDPDDFFSLPNATGGLLPSLTTQKFKLTLLHNNTNGNPQIDRVTVRTTPSNLTLRLGSQPPFWARPGELAYEETVPDFSVMLNAFLAELQAKDGFYEIPLTLHSDTLCRLDVDVEIEFVQKQTALPGGITETALTFDHSTLPQGESGVISVQLPAGARVLPGQTTGRLRGSFANSRVVYGPTGKFDPAGTVKVSPERAQASPLVFSENLALSSLDLLLTSTSRTAELVVDLAEDLDGKPSTDSVLPAQVNVDIDSQIAGKPTWISLSLPAEVQVNAGTRLWLVVQSLRGEADWSVVSQEQVGTASAGGVWTAGEAVAVDQANGAPLGVRYTDTGGLSWRAEIAPGISRPLAGMVHLRQPSVRYQVPIALQVGDGNAAQRVSLDRFEPLGRVDFTLDFDEFAEAINQAASTSAAAAAPAGEHLLNNEFEIWQRVGDTPRTGGMVVPSGSGIANGLGISPDGKLLYIANIFDNESSRVQLAIVQTDCHRLDGEIDLGPETLYGMAIRPDGSRACVLQDDAITWVDLETRNVVGKSNNLIGASGKPVFSPDGGLLYLIFSRRILVLNVPALESEFLGEQNFERAFIKFIKVDEAEEPVLLAMSPDGNRLFVIVRTEDSQESTLRVYNLSTDTWIFSVDLGSFEGSLFSMALNPDGTRIVIANSFSGEIRVLETRNGQQVGAIQSEAIPLAVAVDPGGRLAYVAFSGKPGHINGFDLARTPKGFLFSDISIGESPRELVILPNGERLYVADENIKGHNIFYHSAVALGAMIPEEWTLTSGRVQPICIEEPFRRGAVLGDFACSKKIINRLSSLAINPATETRTYFPSAISQVIPVVGGVHYELSFWGLATTSEVVAEVIWYGGDCGVQQTDRVPFTPFGDDPELLKCYLEDLIQSGQMAEVGNFILSHRLAATSPAGADLAEVRFTAPANEAAFLDRVSLQATTNALSNGDLQHLDEGQLVGWTLAPEGATGITLITEEQGLRFRNNGAREAALEQAVPFPAQTPFELDFTGQAQASTLGATPRVEIVWLDAGNARMGSAMTAGIPAQGSNRVARRGASPTGTTSALLRVVVPPGSNLLIQGIKFEEVHMTTVPIHVIAQAPGDINVSDLQVVYEMTPPTPPKTLPPGGLCPPTPPEGAPGQGRRGCCYCPHCGETDDLCDPHEVETAGGQPALEGECCHCGARMQQIGGGGRITPPVDVTASRPAGVDAVVVRGGRPPTVVRAPMRPVITRRASLQPALVRVTPLTPEEVIQPPPTLPNIVEVTGVTEEFLSALTAAGLGSLDRLAAATPSEIAVALPDQERRVAERISRNARRLFNKISSADAPDGG